MDCSNADVLEGRHTAIHELRKIISNIMDEETHAYDDSLIASISEKCVIIDTDTDFMCLKQLLKRMVISAELTCPLYMLSREYKRLLVM